MKGPNKPSHKAFTSYMHAVGNSYIAIFKVGYYEQVPAAVKEAVARISKALASLEADRALVREWSGNVVFYPPNSRLVNPELTDERRQEFIDAVLRANPDWLVLKSWDNANAGVHGFSVQIAPKGPA